VFFGMLAAAGLSAGGVYAAYHSHVARRMEEMKRMLDEVRRDGARACAAPHRVTSSCARARRGGCLTSPDRHPRPPPPPPLAAPQYIPLASQPLSDPNSWADPGDEAASHDGSERGPRGAGAV
jgi:hypothetical protein